MSRQLTTIKVALMIHLSS